MVGGLAFHHRISESRIFPRPDGDSPVAILSRCRFTDDVCPVVTEVIDVAYERSLLMALFLFLLI